jgi:hypothetical protein
LHVVVRMDVRVCVLDRIGWWWCEVKCEGRCVWGGALLDLVELDGGGGGVSHARPEHGTKVLAPRSKHHAVGKERLPIHLRREVGTEVVSMMCESTWCPGGRWEGPAARMLT